MLMRFHWGLAVGHTYTHQQPSTNPGFIWADTNQSTRSRDIFEEGELLDQIEDLDNPTRTEHDSHTDGSGDSDTDDDDYDPADEDDHSSSDEDDLECLDLDEMYGQGGSDDED
jgi:hypothetical protein